jgi:hypothetical protein
MTIDGFLQFLGLVVAVYALLGVVNRYRLRLLGWWLAAPTVGAFVASVYLLLFDVVGARCAGRWCSILELSPASGVTPNRTAFLVVLTWLIYVAALSRWKPVGTRHLPLLSALIDRLAAEKRFAELVDFVEPHIELISRCARRQFRLQKLRDAIRWQGNPFVALAKPAGPQPTRVEQWKKIGVARALRAMKPLERLLPQTSRKQEAALRMLRTVYTNEPLVEFIALERSMFAVRLMEIGGQDYDFGDRAFDLMMAHPQSQLRRETLLNQNVGLCFYEIDAKNPLIHALFADAKVAERLEVYRPIGDYPLRLLRQNVDSYRQVISASKPPEDKLVHADPTYIMIRFFDIMVRSSMRDEVEWHMWLFYFDILVGKLLQSMDTSHPDYRSNDEFPNLGYYLIYEILDAYGDWLRTIECCGENSPVVQIGSTAPVHDNGSILKSTILSIGNSIAHLLKEEAEERFITYVLGMLMRTYRDLANRKNGGPRAQEALRRSIIAGGIYGLEPVHIARLGDCYADIDPLLRFETEDFGDALQAALQ